MEEVSIVARLKLQAGKVKAGANKRDISVYNALVEEALMKGLSLEDIADIYRSAKKHRWKSGDTETWWRCTKCWNYEVKPSTVCCICDSPMKPPVRRENRG